LKHHSNYVEIDSCSLRSSSPCRRAFKLHRASIFWTATSHG